MTTVPRYLSATQVAAVLTWPLVTAAVEEAMRVLTLAADSNEVVFISLCQPPRIIANCGPFSASKMLICMPGYVGNYYLPANIEHDGSGDSMPLTVLRSTLACKLLISSFPGADGPHVPNILAHILLFNIRSGHLEYIMEGTKLTAWRTAAASIVATKYLYFLRYANFTARPIKLAIIGCGMQGEAHALGMCATYVVSHVYLWNRTATKAHGLAEKVRNIGPKNEVYVCETPQEAVVEADVICVATSAAVPIINMSMLQKREIHINTVGANEDGFGEVARNVFGDAEVFVDSLSNAKSQLIVMKNGQVQEVGEVIRSLEYPATDRGITVFQSTDMAAIDAIVAQAVLDRYLDTDVMPFVSPANNNSATATSNI